MNYSSFKKIYDNLSDEYKSIIFYLLRDMEHNKDNPKDKIDYSPGLKFAMVEQDITTNELASKLEEKTGCTNLRETVASIIDRGSKYSVYFKDILEILDIDEPYLIKHSEYFRSREGNMEWCFNSISKINQDAVYSLILQLSNLNRVPSFIDSFEHPHESNSLGIISDNDIIDIKHI